MYRKLLAALLLSVLFTSAARPDATAEVSKALAALNAAFEKADLKAVVGLMTDDHVAVTPYYPRPLTREEQLKSLDDHKLTEYKTGKMKLQPLGSEVVLVTYEVTIRGTYKGKALPTRNFASAIWTRRGGKWQEAFYQETPLPR